MADKLTSSDDQPSKADKQRIFAERFEDITNGFGEACEKHAVPVAIAIAIHPEEDHPIVFVRGHQYDIATLLASILKGMRQELISGLSIEPDIDYNEHR